MSSKQVHIEQILEERIRTGVWNIMDRLPPERVLCLDLGVSRGTLRAGLHALCGRGILEMRRGSGTYVRDLPQQELPCSTRKMLLQRLKGTLLLMPGVVAALASRITPMQVTHLERALPAVGIGLHAADNLAFAQAQARFLMEIVHGLENPAVTAALAQVIPNGKMLAKVLQQFEWGQKEHLFALLARVLNACRRVEADAAHEYMREYAGLLLAAAAKEEENTAPRRRRNI